MANWSLPTLTDLYTNFRTYLMNRDSDAVRMNDSRVTAATNLPDYAKRWNDSTKRFENWLSAAWSAIVLSVAGGGTGATNSDDACANLGVYTKDEADALFMTNITGLTADIPSNVALTSVDTDYDVVSISLGPGTWLINACAFGSIGSGATFNLKAKLWDGSTVFASGMVSQTGISSVQGNSIFMSDIITFGATTIVKVTCQSSYTGMVISNAWFGKGTYIHAVKIA